MNEIISALQKALEKAQYSRPKGRGYIISTEHLDYRAVFEMGLAHLGDTLAIFRHARKLKNELEARRKPGKDEREDVPT